MMQCPAVTGGRLAAILTVFLWAFANSGFAASPPGTPVNQSPVYGQTNISLTPFLQASVYSDTDGDAHAASQWQVLDFAATSIVWDSGEDALNRTNRTVPTGYLTYGMTYRWQVRYKDSQGAWSSYSTGTAFVTLGNSGGTELLANGGFESGNLAGWTVVSVAQFPATQNSRAASGGFAAVLGDGTAGTGNDKASLQQAVTIPGSAQSAGLRMKYMVEGFGDGLFAWMGVTVNGIQVANWYADSGGWKDFEMDLFTFIGGQVTVNISSLAGDGSHAVRFYVDDVSVSYGLARGGNPPVIAFQPTNQTVAASSNASFSVTATGTAPLAYQWMKGGSLLTGRTNTVLALSNVTTSDAGSYQVVITNVAGSVTSSVATLIVPAPANLAITAQPQPQTVLAGATATFAVTATGAAPITYQWRINGTNVPSATNASLMIAATQKLNEGVYTVVVSNPTGTMISFPRRLSISPGTVVAWGWNLYNQTSVPTGLGDVVDISAGIMHSLALRSDGTVVAWGGNLFGETNIPTGLTGVTAIAAGANYSVALKIDGTVVAWGRNDGGQTNVPPGLNGVAALSARGSHILALKGDGTIVAWGLNNFGQTNVPANLSGVVAISAGGTYSLALKSDGTVVAWGENSDGQASVPSALNGVIAIAAGGYHSMALKQDGSVVAWGNNEASQSTVPAAITNVLAVSGGTAYSIALQGDGTVGAWGNASQGVTIIPFGLGGVTAIAAGGYHNLVLGYVSSAPPTVTTPPTNQTVAATSNATFSVVATGTAPLAFQWRKDGAPLAGQTNTTLNIASVTTNDAGSYQVIVANTSGSVTSIVATLTINRLSPGLAWTNLSPIVYGTALGTNQLKATASVAGVFSYNPPAGAILGFGTNTLLVSFTPTNSAVYSNDTRNNFLFVNQALLTIRPYDISREYGQTNPPLSAAFSGFVNGDTSTVLTQQPVLSTTATSSSPVGTYPITATGASASNYSIFYSNAVLTVFAYPPSITQQPTNQTSIAGSSATMSVATTGTAPLFHRWRLGSTNIAGQTNATLNIPVVNSTNAGNYTVVITNSFGSVTSQVATLTVLVPPAITNQPVSLAIPAGFTTNFSVGATGTSPLRFQWLMDGASITNATNSTLTIRNLRSANAGGYSVVITNIAGSVTSVVATLTVLPPISVPLFPWAVRPGSSSADAGHGVAILSNVLYVAGNFGGTATFGSTNVSVAGSSDMYLARYMTDGTFQWVVKGGGSGTDEGYSAAPDGVANTFVTGHFQSTATFSGQSVTSAGGDDMFLASYSPNGALRWVNRAGGTGTDVGLRAAVDSAGNAYVAGYFSGTASFSGTNNVALTNIVSAGSADIFLASYDNNGSFRWVVAAGGSSSDMAFGIAVNPSDEVYICGIFNGTAAFGATNLVSAGGQDAFVARYTTTGNLVWTRRLGGTGTDSAYRMHSRSAGRVAIAGSFAGTAGFVTSNLTAVGAMDGFTLVLDGNGSVEWVAADGLDGSDETFDVGIEPDGYVLSTGYFKAGSQSATNYGAFFRQRTQAGIVASTTMVSGTSHQGYTIRSDDNGSAYASGILSGSANFKGISPASIGSFDIFLARLDFPPSIGQQPQGVSVVPGSSPALSAIVGGTAPLSLQWRYNGNPLEGETSANLTFPGITLAQAGNYDLVVTNDYGSVTSAVATVSIGTPPSIQTQPADQSVPAGGPAGFTVSATGDTTLAFQWFKGIAPLSGQTNTVLSLANVTTNDAGPYQVVVSNPGGSVTSVVATLTVNRLDPGLVWANPGAVPYGAALDTNLLNASAAVAGVFVYTPASGTVPNASINTLQVMFTPANTGVYSNANASAALIVTPAPLLISANNVSRDYGLTNPVLTASFSGFVSGQSNTVLTQQPVLTTTATPSSPVGTYPITVNGASASNYAISYSNGTLTVLGNPPIITNQPVSVAIPAGYTTNFSVGVSGTPPLKYQWLKDGATMTNATNSTLTIYNIRSTNAGDYLVTVANGFGSTTSQVVSLTVLPPISVPVFPWAIRAGSSFADTGWGISVLSNALYFAGRISGNSTFGSLNVTGGSSDTFLARYTRDGSIQWVVTGGEEADTGHSVASDASGNAFVTGYFYGTTTFGGQSITSAGMSDIFVASYNPDGALRWLNRAGGTDYDIGRRTAVDSVGNVYVAGEFNGTATFSSATGGSATNIVSSGLEEIFLASYDNNGNFRWVISAGGSHSDSAYGITINPSDEIYVCGFFADAAAFGSTNLVSAGSDDVFVARYTTAGSLVWARRFGGTGADLAFNMHSRNAGRVAVAGSFAGTANFLTTNLTAVGATDGFTLVLDGNGNVEWVAADGLDGNDRTRGVAVEPDGYVLSTGYFKAGSQSATNYGAFFRQRTQAGIVANTTIVSGSEHAGFTIGADENGSAYAAGVLSDSANFNGIAPASIGNFDLFLARLDFPPSIGQQPQGVSVVPGSSLALSAIVGGTAPLSLQWRYNGTPLGGQTSLNLTLPGITLAQAGNYDVVVTNNYGSVTSIVATVSIGTPPSIQTQPADQTVPAGGPAGFTVSATGDATLAFQWFKGIAPLSGQTNTGLTLANVTTNDAGTYIAVVSNPGGSVTSVVATLTVNRLDPGLVWANPSAVGYGAVMDTNLLNATAAVSGVFAYTPSSGTRPNAGTNNIQVIFTPANTGVYSNATRSVALVVTPAPLLISANNLSRDYGLTNPILTANFSGFVSGQSNTVLTQQPVLTTTATPSSPVGTYPISVSGASAANYAITYSNGTFTVLASSPIITNQPVSLSIPAGATASFSVGAKGTAPLTYQWFRYVTNVTPSIETVLVTGMSDADGPNFSYYAQPILGYDFTPNTSISIGALGAYDHHFDGLDQTHQVGLWEKNSQTLLASGSVPAGAVAPLQSGYRWTFVAPVILSAGVTYTLASWNSGFESTGASQKSSLTVDPRLSLGAGYLDTLIPGLQMPTRQGGPGVVFVGPGIATAIQGLSAIPGATNSTLTLNNVQSTNAGDYLVIVANGFGSVTSQVATLTVLPPASGPVFPWAIRAGTNTAEAGHSVAMASNAVYVAGNTWGSSMFGPTNLFGSGGTQMFLARYGRDGAFEWVVTGGGSSTDEGYGVASDAAGNAFVTGYFQGTATFSGQSVTSAGGSDAFLASYDPSGAVRWAVRAGGGGADVGLRTAVDTHGNVYLVGYFSTNLAIGGTNIYSLGFEDIFVASYDNDGNFRWVVRAGGTGSDLGLGVTVNDGDEIYVSGSFSGTAYFGSTNLVSAGGKDAFVARYTTSGTLVWARQFGGSNNDTAYRIHSRVAGRVAVSGSYSATATFLNTILASVGSLDGFTLVLDSSGGLEWVAADASGQTYDVAIEPSGYVLSTGYITNSGAFFRQRTQTGVLVNNVILPSGSNAGYTIKSDENGAAYAAGIVSGTASFSGISPAAFGSSDIFLARLDFPPSIGLQPVSVAAIDGSSPTFSAIAGGTAPLSLQWRLNGTPLGGQTSLNLTLPGIMLAQTGNYDLVVNNNYGSVTSLVATLTVINAILPLILTQPSNQVAIATGAAAFSITATGTLPIAYQWLKGGVTFAGQTNATLSLANLTTNDSAGYQVIVSNVAGSVTSIVATLTVNRRIPALTWTTPNALTYGAMLGSNQLNAIFGPPGSVVYAPPAGTLLGVGTSMLYAIFTPTDGHLYERATGSVAIAVNPALLTVKADDKSRVVNQQNPGLTYTLSGFVNGESRTNSDVAGSPALTTEAVNSSPRGAYPISVASGTLTSQHYLFDFQNGTLTILDPPRIVTQPPQSILAVTEQDVDISVSAVGFEPLSYQWFRDGSMITDATNRTLVFASAAVTNSGAYWVTISNLDGSTNSTTARLAVGIAYFAPPPSGQSTQIHTNGFNLDLRMKPGTQYRIEMSTDLVYWVTMTNFTATTAVMQFLDAAATNSTGRFYRAIAAP